MFVFTLISMCAADIIYHKPIDVIEDGYPVFSKYPPYSPYGPYKHYYGPYKHDLEYDALYKKKSFGDELKEYWNVFVDSFKSSYKEITKPYIVERPVPVPVPGKTIHNFIFYIQFLFSIFFSFKLSVPVEHTRTIIKEHPVFIKPRPKVVYRKIRYSKHG